MEFVDVSERSGYVPSGPTLDHCKPAETLFALFELLQDAERRYRRREAIIAGPDQFRAAGKLDVKKQRPLPAQNSFAYQPANNSFGRRFARNLNVVVRFVVDHGRVECVVEP